MAWRRPRPTIRTWCLWTSGYSFKSVNEVARDLRQEPSLENVLGPSAVRRTPCRRSGLDSHIVKPFRMESMHSSSPTACQVIAMASVLRP